MQSRWLSLIEAWTNTLVGYILNIVGHLMLLPLFGATLSVASNMQVSLVMVVLSVLRSYCLRRIFNKIRPEQNHRWSLIEAWTNTIVGYAINFSAQLLLLPLFGVKLSMSQNIALSTFFVLLSVVRGYMLRRLFCNIRFHNKKGESWKKSTAM